MSLADSEDRYGGAPARVLREDETGQWHSLYRCTSCLRYKRPWHCHHSLTVQSSAFEDFDEEDLSDLFCSECAIAKEVKEWNREWHVVMVENQATHVEGHKDASGMDNSAAIRGSVTSPAPPVTPQRATVTVPGPEEGNPLGSFSTFSDSAQKVW